MQDFSSVTEGLVRGAVSGGVLVGLDTYLNTGKNKPRSLFSTDQLKKFGFQALSSVAVDQIKKVFKPLLPNLINDSTMWINPLIVGGSYTLLVKFISGSNNYMYNFMYSMAAEMIAGFVEPPLYALLPSSGSITLPSVTAVQPNRRSVLG
jgi:hypothetical protein